MPQEYHLASQDLIAHWRSRRISFPATGHFTSVLRPEAKLGPLQNSGVSPQNDIYRCVQKNPSKLAPLPPADIYFEFYGAGNEKIRILICFKKRGNYIFVCAASLQTTNSKKMEYTIQWMLSDVVLTHTVLKVYSLSFL